MAPVLQDLRQIETEGALQVGGEVGDADPLDRLSDHWQLPDPVVLATGGSRDLGRLTEERDHPSGKFLLRAPHQEGRGDRGTPVGTELRKAAEEFRGLPRPGQASQQVGVTGPSRRVVRDTEFTALLIGKERVTVGGGREASLHAARKHQATGLAPGSFQPTRELQISVP